jgi:hypothetical protein
MTFKKELKEERAIGLLEGCFPNTKKQMPRLSCSKLLGVFKSKRLCKKDGKQ